jgi:hypothetical protein
MEVDEVPIGLDGDDDARKSGRVLARCSKESLQGIDSALPQPPKKPAILPETPGAFG